MIYTATKQSKLFGGCCGLMGIMPGVPFLGAYDPNRPYDPNRQYDLYVEHYKIPYTNAAVGSLFAPFLTEEQRQASSMTALRNAIGQFEAAVKVLEEYRAFAIQYYTTRINRTSGGKKSRLLDERDIIQAEAERALKTAKSALAVLTNSLNAKAATSLREAGSDPAQTVVSRDADSGALVYSRPLPVSQAQAAPQSNMPAWLLPAGIGLAAILALKG